MDTLPLIARPTPNLVRLWSHLQPNSTKLTADDEFLIALNAIWSTDPNRLGYSNQPRHYQFQQRIVSDTIKIPDLPDPDSLQHIVNTTSQQIISRNQPIKLFWSGGIDSTLVAAALLPLISNTDQIEIYLTCESIRENPKFYDYIQKFNAKTIMWSDQWHVPFKSDDLIVTGTSADEITGSLDRSFFDEYSTCLNQPWQQFFKTKGCNEDFINRCQELFSSSHGTIKTVFDARWWFYFYIRHTNWARRDWQYNLENDFEKNTVQFYNNSAFDNWSIHNKESLIGSKYCDYKKPLK